MINDFTKKEAPVLSTLGLGGGNASRLILSSGPVGLATTVATRSLRLSSAYLTRTPSSEGDRKTWTWSGCCLLYTSPSPRDISGSRMPSSA